jgi:hypothetical protein
VSPQNITTGPHGSFLPVNGLRDYLLHTWRSHTLGEIAHACELSVTTITAIKNGDQRWIHRQNADQLMRGLARLQRPKIDARTAYVTGAWLGWAR